MAHKTLHFVQGLSRTPLLSIPRYLTNIFPKKYVAKIQKISRIDNLEISKVDPGKLVESFSPRDGPVAGIGSWTGSGTKDNSYMGRNPYLLRTNIWGTQ